MTIVLKLFQKLVVVLKINVFTSFVQICMIKLLVLMLFQSIMVIAIHFMFTGVNFWHALSFFDLL